MRLSQVQVRHSLSVIAAVGLLVGLAMAPTVASAQDEDGDSSRKVQYKERTEIDFEGVDVSGELVKPSGSLLIDRKKAQFNPLITLREEFNDEMKESVNEVK
jgi:hypothetical protein